MIIYYDECWRSVYIFFYHKMVLVIIRKNVENCQSVWIASIHENDSWNPKMKKIFHLTFRIYEIEYLQVEIQLNIWIYILTVDPFITGSRTESRTVVYVRCSLCRFRKLEYQYEMSSNKIIQFSLVFVSNIDIKNESYRKWSVTLRKLHSRMCTP